MDWINNIEIETRETGWPEINRANKELQENGGALMFRGCLEKNGFWYAVFSAPGYQVAARIDWACNLTRSR